MTVQFTKINSIYRDSNTKATRNVSTENAKCICLIEENMVANITSIHHGKFEEFINLVDFFSFSENDYDKIFQLIIENKNNNLEIIFINNKKSFNKKLHQALLMSEDFINYSIIDEELSENNNNYPLKHLSETDTSFFFNLCFAAHQAHLSEASFPEKISQCNISSYRLAEVRAQTDEWSSALRDTEVSSIVLTCLKASELLTTTGLTSSSGLTVEELAQISYDLGLSPKNRILNICLPETIQDSPLKQTEISLQILWYYLLGLNNQVDSFPLDINDFQEYAIEECFGDVNILFYKSLNSGKWWLKIPFDIKKEYERHIYVPCTYQDYLDSVNGEMSGYLADIFNAFEQARIE